MDEQEEKFKNADIARRMKEMQFNTIASSIKATHAILDRDGIPKFLEGMEDCVSPEFEMYRLMSRIVYLLVMLDMCGDEIGE